jgi:ribosomal-protein-alanine N-acetyltransferase
MVCLRLIFILKNGGNVKNEFNFFEHKTKRLIIRPLKEKDFEIWKKAHEDMLEPQNTWDVAHREHILTKARFKKVLAWNKKQRKLDRFIDYIIIEKKSGRIIGRMSLMDIARSITQSAFLGYSLFNNHWGKGYAEEAVKGIIKLAFNEHNLHRIVAGIEPQNKRSLALARKLGMRREGIARRVVSLRGEWRDLVQFALTTEDLN